MSWITLHKLLQIQEEYSQIRFSELLLSHYDHVRWGGQGGGGVEEEQQDRAQSQPSHRAFVDPLTRQVNQDNLQQSLLKIKSPFFHFKCQIFFRLI